MRGSGTLTRAILALGATLALAASKSPPPDLGQVLAKWDQDEHPDLRGVVIVRRGKRVAERYYNGTSPTALHDIRSAGKSVTALMIGIAIDRRAIRSIDDPVSRYWPAAKDSPIGPVALRDVLTMRSGLAAFDEDPDSPGNEDRMDEAADPLAFVRAIPSETAPGTRYRYNSLTSYVAGLSVAHATGGTMASLAGQTLFAPLGITDWRWDADKAGITKGQGNLWLTTRDLSRIGEMVRSGGRFDGHRIIAAGWISEMLKPRVSIADSDPYADSYGYYWYRKTHQIDGSALTVSFASGNGGNKIYVVPGCDLVVAITSAAYGRGYGQRRSEAILKAVLAAENRAGNCRADSV
jgi:CubicO group peptidase (beta-lactamase class C family)